jgi:hypothetical protein
MSPLPDPRPPRRPYFWAAWWSVLIGIVLFFGTKGISPDFGCSASEDWGAGRILRAVPPGRMVPGHAVWAEKGPLSGFPPQSHCRLLQGARGEPRVLAEADYPTTTDYLESILIALSPLIGTWTWQAAKRRRFRARLATAADQGPTSSIPY